MKLLKSGFYLFLFSYIWFGLNSADAQIVAIKKNANFNENVSNKIASFEDATGILSLEDVIRRDSFSYNKNNFGLTKSAIWIRLKISNPKNYNNIYLEIKNPTFDKITLYIPSNTDFRPRESGQSVALARREIDHQNPVFKVQPQNKDTVDYYFKIQSSNPLTIPVFIGDFASINKGLTTRDIFFSLYLGLIISMFLYNIFIYFTVRERSYLFYVIYIFFVGFTQVCLHGYSYKFIWHNNIWLNNEGIIFSISFVGISSLFFVKEFLQVKRLMPKVNFYLNIVIALLISGFVLSLLGYPRQAQLMIQGVTFFASISVVIIGIITYGKKYKPALYFTISWSCFLLGVVVFILKDVGILPYNFLTNNSILISSGVEAILLSFALADKINIFKKEKEESQAEALRISKENEQLVREQNIILESKVKERTEELENTNHTLNNTLNNLKETQSQLVEAEKMASLGQLTAGIAHEINNPINFVTSNIRPLQLDILDLTELITKYERLNLDGNLQAQLAEIESFKQQIDLSYLKTEINSLLLGIGEGAKRTAEIVRSLKNFSRLDEDDTKPIDLNEGIESTLVLVKSNIPSNLVIKRDFGDLPLVECLPGKMNQVFMNLITNAIQAIKAKESQNDEEYIQITTKRENDQVKISIKDTGMGIPEELITKIFEPFFTTKDVGEGTGLGLSIVFRIIDKHNGHIDVLSKLNQGTEFIITLPIN